MKKSFKKYNKNSTQRQYFFTAQGHELTFLDRSDYEVGVLYKKENVILRAELEKLSPSENVNIYPFEYEGLKEYMIDTPFPKNIYIKELIEGGKTLSGEKVLENLPSPKISTLDLIQRINFDMGWSLTSLLSHRHGDLITASTTFAKSCLFGVRCLIILENNKFPLTYKEIQEAAREVDLGEYSDIVDHAMYVRLGAELEKEKIYRNISFLNRFISPKILNAFEQHGNQIHV